MERKQISSVSRLLAAAGIFMIALALIPVWASDSASAVKSEVQALVDRFPAQNTEERQNLASELLGIGTEGILEVCRLLAAPGTGDDTSARYAMSALTTFVSQRGEEQKRLVYAKTLFKALEQEPDKEVKAFLIRQVQQAGKRESIKPLRGYLDDDRLCDPATQALLAIGSKQSEKALLKALKTATGANRVTIVKALGEMRAEEATKKILPFAADENTELRQVALFALANIGDPLAEKAVNAVSLGAPSYERTRAPALYLLYARRLGERGHTAQTAGICRKLIVHYTAPQESHIACSALTLLVDTLGENAFADLLQAMDARDPELRARALDLAGRIPGEKATAGWIERLEGAPPDVQAQIIAMLGRRGDPEALPVLREKLKSPHKAVKLASIPAAARLGGEEVFSDLLSLLRTDQQDQITVVKQALMGFPSRLLISGAVKILDKVPIPSRVALMEILSERRAKEYRDIFFAGAENDNPGIRQAALSGLANLAGPQDMPRLIAMLLEADDSRAIRLIQDAIVAAADQIEDREKRAGLLIAALQEAEEHKQSDLLRPLPRIGGQEALETVIARTKSENLQVKTAAISVLADWPDFGAAEELSRIWQDTDSPKYLLVAVRGYVRLVHESSMAPEAKLDRYKEVLGRVSYPAAKAIVLGPLGAVPSVEAFKIAAAFLEVPELRSQAAGAVARLAFSDIPLDKEFSRPQLLTLFQKTARHVENAYSRQGLDERIGIMLREEGFAPLFNGKDLSGWKGLVEDPVKRARMTLAEMEKAQKLADESMRVHWKVEDGILVFDGRGDSLCTIKDYTDFELYVDWKIEEGGDSGIYLRGSPQVQIWGPDQSPDGSGGLYNNQKGPSKPLVRADNPVGDWNTFFIRMTGERVTVYLNGILVTDEVAMENYWERDRPIYPVGQIELQAHSTPLYFRNIYIREIPGEEDFVPLFNGLDLM